MARGSCVLKILLVACMCLASACAGSGGADPKPKVEKIPLGEVCDGLFSGQGERVLRDLVDAAEFSPSHDWAGKEGTAERLLHSSASSRDGISSETTMCSVYPMGDGSSLSHIRIRFSLADGGELPDDGHAETLRLYDLGERALVGVKRAFLYYECVTPRAADSKAKPLLISGDLLNRYPPEEDTPQLREANLAALNHAALAVARELKCENDAGLVEKPKLTPASSS